MLDVSAWRTPGGGVPCRWRLEPAPPRARVTVVGELDLSSTPALAADTSRISLDGLDTLAIDLAAVTFADSSSLGWLLGLHRRARERDTTVLVHAPEGPVSRLLRLSGVDQVLNVLDVPYPEPPVSRDVAAFPPLRLS